MAFFVADVGVILTFTITDQAGAVVNLATATVNLLVFGLPSLPCVITNAAAGIASYTIISGTTFPAGTHAAQLEIIDGSNVYHTTVFSLVVKNLYTS